MTIAGWIFMLTSWTIILGTLVYCIARAARQRPMDADADAND